MHKFLRFFGKFLAALLIVVFIITLVAGLILYGPTLRLTNSSLYKRALTDLNVYKNFSSLVRNLLPSQVNIDRCFGSLDHCRGIPTENLPLSIKLSLTPANWQTLGETMFPESEIQDLAESTLDSFFGFLNGTNDQVEISLFNQKDALISLIEEKRLQQLFLSQPACSEAFTIQSNTANLLQTTLPLCKYPDFILNQLITLLPKPLSAYISTIPDVIHLRLPFKSITTIRLYLWLFSWLPLVLLILLSMILLLGVRSLRSALRLGGILLVIGSAFPFIVGLAVRYMSPALLGMILRFIPKAALNAELIGFLNLLGRYLIDHLTNWVIYPALIILLSGISAWIASARIRRKSYPPISLSPTHPMETGKP